MRAAILLVAKLAAIVTVASEAAMIMDGSAALAPLPRETIIVETVQQPARHRPSLAFILVVFVIGLFMGALALLLCVLCLLKTLSGRYWPVAQKDDIFFMIESHEKLLANTKFQKQKANEPADTPMANKESDVEGSARGAIKSAGSVMYSTRNDQQNTRKAPLLSAQDEPTYETPRGDFLEPQYCRDMHQHTPGSSNWKRHTFKSSGNVQHRQELYSDDENVSGHSGARGLSNLRLDFRINEKSSCKTLKRKKAKDLRNKNTLMDASMRNLKETMAVRHSDCRASQASEADENICGEKNTMDVYQSSKKDNHASRPHSRNTEHTPRPASTTPRLGRTTSHRGDDAEQLAANANQLKLNQIEALIAEMLNKDANRKVKHSS
ncbi:hypothetical protein MRX96_026847 [Rhipicephalus microplus]